MITPILLNTLQQSLEFLPLALGIYLSYEILILTDLTVGGTFVLGAAVFAKLFSSHLPQSLGIVLALTAGFIVGLLVCLMQRVARINSLIAGILAVFMLYSINFAVMGRINIGLFDTNHLALQSNNHFIVWGTLIVVSICAGGGLILLLRSRLGLLLRAFGSNPFLLEKLGHQSIYYLGLGLAVSNLLAALSGLLTAQANGYADINMGEGVALIGIGSVVMGCQLIKSLLTRRQYHFNVALDIGCCFVGVFLYFLILNILVKSGINLIYLKLALGMLLVFFLSTAHYSGRQGDQHGELAEIK